MIKMKFSYYPGCTLKTKAKDLEKAALNSAQALGINLVEQEEWQCCGAVYPLANDELATKLSAVRSLIAAKEKGESLVTLCSACHQVIKRANNAMKTEEDTSKKINNYLELEEPYQGEGKVIHYLEMLRDEVGFDKLAEKVKNPLTERKIGAYYGCLLLRPNEVMGFDDPENPTIIEDFLKALGATAIKYPYRTECCGGYLTIDNEKITEKMTENIVDSASNYEAQEIVTACPLCKYNLEEQNKKEDSELSITYFTELLAEALAVEVK